MTENSAERSGKNINVNKQELRNVPELRFPGFEEEWSEKRIVDCTEIKGRIGFRGYKTSDLVEKGEGALTIGGKHIKNNKICLDDPEYLSWEKFHESPEIEVKKGDIILAQRGTLGVTALIDEDIGPATINPSMVLLKNISVNKKFLYQVLTTPMIIKEIIKKSSSTAVPMISQRDIKNIHIKIPKENEQEKISEFLMNIDKKIELMEKKYHEMLNYKNFLLINMFPTKNQSPKIRFKEFLDEWDELYLKDLVYFLNDKRIPLNQTKRDKLENIYPYYGAAGIIDYVDNYLFDDKLVLLGEDGTIIPHLVSGKIWVSNHAHVLKNKEDINIDFLYYSLLRINFNMYNTGTIQPKLNKETAKKIKIYVPKFEEQKKIVNLIENIDNNIKLNKKNIELNKKFKRSLLSKMFC